MRFALLRAFIILMFSSGLIAAERLDPDVVLASDRTNGEINDRFLPFVRSPITWTDCSQSRMGSTLMSIVDFNESTGPELVRLAQDGYTGLTAAATFATALEYFPNLTGWDKAHVCNSLDCLSQRVTNSLSVGLEYDYLAYGPERLGGVPPEEKYNLPWATQQARLIADGAGKGLILGYSTTQLHQEAEERGYGWENVGEVINLLAGYGDKWLIQAADEYNNPYTNPEHPDPILSQRHFPPGSEWRAEAEKWVNWIKAANPNIEIWIQLALHRIPAGPPPWEDNYPSAELLLEYREWLVNPVYGPPLVDGVYISSVYSWPVDPIVADQEMERAIRWACDPQPLASISSPPTSNPSRDRISKVIHSLEGDTSIVPDGLTPIPIETQTTASPASPSAITLVQQGWTDNLVMGGMTILPGYYYRLYENSAYPCGMQGNHQFLVVDHGTDMTAPKHLFTKFLGGAVGFYYYDNGTRLYYPQPNAVGLLTDSLNRNWMFANSVSLEKANGVTKRFRENDDYRILIPSYCSHDLYHATGQYHSDDGFYRYGYLAAMEAVDYVQANYNVDKLVVYGGSAGAAGFYIGKDQDNVVGIIMDSQAVDLKAISDACYNGYNVFGGSQPCFCPDGGLTCMEELAPRIGFTLGLDEPYRFVQRGEVNAPLYLVWNQYDASRYAHLQYDNLHNAILQYNPAGRSVAEMVCITDPRSQTGPTCNLHVPSAQDFPETIPLVERIYNWALSLVNSQNIYLPLIMEN